MKRFSLAQPGNILFGAGTRHELPQIIEFYGSKVLLFTGFTWFKGSRWREEILDLLEPFECRHIQCPSGEPTSEGLEKLLDEARAFNPEVLLAVGGGSILDTAKAVSGLIPRRERVDDFLEGVGQGLQILGPGVPWIAVPTTSGTGAEATKNAVLRTTLGYKKSLRSPFLLAGHVVVDPELTVECSLSLTGIAGMDALTQLVESFVSRKSAPVPRALAVDAFPLMLEALNSLPNDLENSEARSNASYGALISGITLANSGLGAAHGFASGLGGLYEIPHGLICALFIRPVLKANADLIRGDCALLRQNVQLRLGSSGSEKDPVEWLIEQIDQIFRRFGLPEDLKQYRIDQAIVSKIAARSSGSSMAGNPRELNQNEREAMIAAII
ncbi:MAG TPA: iron-containing alcohol dehydrogenase [bacterium]|nr:iron-containing alcohol dehydrogenase [bacterium]